MAESSVHTLVAPRRNSPEDIYLKLVDEAQRLMPGLRYHISRACRSTARMQAVIDIYESYTLLPEQVQHLMKMREFQETYG